jgi:hypothetical protein
LTAKAHGNGRFPPEGDIRQCGTDQPILPSAEYRARAATDGDGLHRILDLDLALADAERLVRVE